MSLTTKQKDMLELLAANDREMDGIELARLLYGNHQNPQGAHVTAASLVSHGYLTRIGADRRLSLVGEPPLPVRYRINVEGLLLVSELRKIRAALQ